MKLSHQRASAWRSLNGDTARKPTKFGDRHRGVLPVGGWQGRCPNRQVHPYGDALDHDIPIRIPGNAEPAPGTATVRTIRAMPKPTVRRRLYLSRFVMSSLCTAMFARKRVGIRRVAHAQRMERLLTAVPV